MMNKPKILIGISASFCAHFLKGQLAFLRSRGYNVVVISGKGKEIEELCKKENAVLYNVAFTNKLSPFRDFFLLLRIIKILKAEKPLVVNAGNPKAGFLVILACYFMQIKNRVFTMHGLYSDNKKGLARLFFYSMERFTCCLANEVIVVSETLKQHAIGKKILNNNKANVLEHGSYNGLPHVYKNMPSLDQSQVLKSDLGLSDKHIIIGYVGRINIDKGVELLLKALDQLVSINPLIKLVIAGPVQKQNSISHKSLQRLFTDNNIIYLGNMLDVRPVYNIIDMLILPSYREGFANVLIEAASFKKPVIAPDIPGCRDAVKRNVNGLFFEKGNLGSLVDKMELYISDKNLRIQHGENGQRFVANNFCSIKIWEAQARLYEELIHSNQNPIRYSATSLPSRSYGNNRTNSLPAPLN